MSEEQNTPSGIIGEIKALEQKVEHALGLDGAPSSTEPQVGNVLAANAAPLTPSADTATSASSQSQIDQAATENGAAASQESSQAASPSSSDTPVVEGGGELPNVGASSAETPFGNAAELSVGSVLQDAATPALSGSAGLRSAVIERLKNIKQLLAVHHFEQSLVQGIHDELDAIEGMI